MWLFDLLFFFSSLPQHWYVEVWISRSVSESPLEFEITKVDCILKSREGPGQTVQLHMLIQASAVHIWHEGYFLMLFIICPGSFGIRRNIEEVCLSEFLPDWTISCLTHLAIKQTVHRLDLIRFVLLQWRSNEFVCLCWDFTAQSTQWGHVERGQFT